MRSNNMVSSEPYEERAHLLVEDKDAHDEDGHDFTSLSLADEFAHSPVVFFNSKGEERRRRRYRAEEGVMSRSSVGFLGKVKRAAERALDKKALVIACNSVGSSLLGTVFDFYYIKVFLTIYHLNDRWLNIVQILFAVWNAFNDPLFGYLQDVGFSCCPAWFMNRRKVILYVGPFYALSFMIFWMPWSDGSGQPSWVVGLHLLTALFLFDTMLTFALSAECGLFTESTTKHEGRVRTVVYMQTAGLVGAFVIYPVDAISKNLQDFRAFQICTAVVAVVAAVFMMITGLFASDVVAQTKTENDLVAEGSDGDSGGNFKAAVRASKEILSNRDFWCVVCGNFFHILRTTADANFLAILIEALLSPNGILPLGSTQLSLFYTGCAVLARVSLLIFWPLLNRFGAYSCLMITLAFALVNCIVTEMVGRTYFSWLALYFLIENILAKGIYLAVYNTFFPDIIDEDMILHKRKSPISTLIFTMNALFTKPAASIAPMIVVALLNGAGYERYLRWQKASIACNSSTSSSNGGLVTTNHNGINCTTTAAAINASFEGGGFGDLYATMFHVACLFPLACAICEAISLLPYRLKYRHKRDENMSQESELQRRNMGKEA